VDQSYAQLRQAAPDIWQGVDLNIEACLIRLAAEASEYDAAQDARLVVTCEAATIILLEAYATEEHVAMRRHRLIKALSFAGYVDLPRLGARAPWGILKDLCRRIVEDVSEKAASCVDPRPRTADYGESSTAIDAKSLNVKALAQQTHLREIVKMLNESGMVSAILNPPPVGWFLLTEWQKSAWPGPDDIAAVVAG